MDEPFFSLYASDPDSKARLGRLMTAHGAVDTPAFMPVGTRGCVKAITSDHLEQMGAQIILGNTYHLLLRPGMELMEKAGGLHAFASWSRPLLTDSGGFQVFSLAALNSIGDDGVRFQSHIDGSRHFLGPKESMEIQKIIGADIAMAFDECSPYPCSFLEAEQALHRTHSWAKICKEATLRPYQKLFGIVQGSVYPELRRQSAITLGQLDFDGYALGGLSVGEPAGMMYQVIDETEPHLPKEKPRYLMGVGTPRNLIEAVRRGVDMFDCVMPTRNGRNGTLFTWEGKLSIKSARYAADFTPIDPQLDSYASRFSRAYLRHLLQIGEINGLILASLQNVAFYLAFMREIRQALLEGRFSTLYQRVCQLYPE